MADLCATCSARKAEYDALITQLNTSKTAAENAKNRIKGIQDQFQKVVTNGSSLGYHELANCFTNFTTVISNLNSDISDCEAKIDLIVSNCPGPRHYDEPY